MSYWGVSLLLWSLVGKVLVVHCSVLFVFTSQISCSYSILIEFAFLNFGLIQMFKLFLHISVNVCTSMTKYGSLFCEACWMLVDCNTEQYTQLNNIDYLYDVFDPFGGFAIVMVLFLWWLCHCSGFCIRQCGISQLGYLWCILCLYGWHCEYGDTTVTGLSWYTLWSCYCTDVSYAWRIQHTILFCRGVLHASVVMVVLFYFSAVVVVVVAVWHNLQYSCVVLW